MEFRNALLAYLRIPQLRAVFAVVLSLIVAVRYRDASAEDTSRLFVFASTDTRAYTFEQELRSEMPGVDVRVFSRLREFEQAVSKDKPDAVLARPVFLESIGKIVELRGQRDGYTEEPFVLLSIGLPLKPTDLEGKTLGVVSIVGRQAMNRFVSSVLGVPPPHLKHVNSERDLLALLRFGEAQVVLLSQWSAGKLIKTSQADLRTTVLTVGVGLPSVSFASPSAKAKLVGKFRTLSTATNRRLGVDRWE
jgi:hypothetical protein